MVEALTAIANGDYTRIEEVLNHPKTRHVIESAASRVCRNHSERKELIETAESITAELLMRNFKIKPEIQDIEGLFLGYLSKTLWKRLLSFKQQGAVKNSVSLEHLISLADWEFEDRMIERIDLENAIASLTVRQRQVIKGIYFLGLTPREIAQQLGISHSRVSQLHLRAMAIIRMKLREDDIS